MKAISVRSGFQANRCSRWKQQPTLYRYPDNNDFAGKTYYRLKQEDIDGRTLHSVTLANGESKPGKHEFTGAVYRPVSVGNRNR